VICKPRHRLPAGREENMISGKLLLLSAAALAVSLLPITSYAQATSTQSYERLAAAFALDTAGHPQQAIAVAETLLASGSLSKRFIPKKQPT
jgi:hypothetical protein